MGAWCAARYHEISEKCGVRACSVSQRAQIAQQIFRQTTAIFRSNTVMYALSALRKTLQEKLPKYDGKAASKMRAERC